jgi:tetratricopeptide (TPR) repeat protein
VVERIVRERGQVGRRIWRRRKRRTTGPQKNEAELGPLEEIPEPEPPPTPPPPKKGFIGTLKGLFSKRDDSVPKNKKAPVDPPYLVVDPTRDVLAVPRGAARLDAFERAIQTTPTGTPQFRALALAFHRELSLLAEQAGVDLSLFETRVEACAQALIAAGEDERAGTLFLRVGRRHQAAELFVKAGAIDALEEAHAQIQWDEGGTRHQARLEFERFEALFLVGMRDQALAALTKAYKLWGDNPVYTEVYNTFIERLGTPHHVMLKAPGKELVVVGKWPLIIGRGEEAALRLQSPLLSRAHLRLGLRDGVIYVNDLESRGGTRVDGEPLDDRRPLRIGASIDMAGVVVHTAAVPGGILLTPALTPQSRTLALISERASVPLPSGHGDIPLHFDAAGRAIADPPASLNGEALRRPTLLLHGDQMGSWTVAGSK